MKKQNADASAARTVNRPLFILSLVVRVIAVLAAVFCLYRVAQLVGGNNVSLSDTQITAAVRDTSGRTVHTSGDLRKNTGSAPETLELTDGFTCEIESKKNARKKYIQVTLTVKDPNGETVWQSDAEPLQFTEEIHADITMVFTAADGSISADVSAAVKEARHISDNLLIYCLGLAAGIAVFAVVSTASRHFRQNTAVARFNRTVSSVGRYALLAVILVIALFPILWMLFASLMPSQHVMQIPPVFGITSESSFANYIKVFSQAKYLRYYLNSVVTSGGTVAVVMLIALMASYSFSRYEFWGRNAVLTLILSVQMFPIVAILISLYGFYMRWNLVDHYSGVILADTVQALPLAIMLLRSFFDTLPRSLDESARIDGAGRIRTMLSILVPLTIPGLVAVGIYTFLNAWDDYLMALTIMKNDSMKTLTVGLAQSFLGEYAHDYGALMAFAMGGSLPIVLLFIFFQKYMISGLTAGAVKG